MVAIFAREITDDLASLVKEIDTKVAENEDQKMAAYLVLLTDDPDDAEPKLKELAEKHDIQNVPLTVFDGAAGPPAYKIAEDADVTVVQWVRTKVQASRAFAKGKLDKKGIEQVVADTEKIL